MPLPAVAALDVTLHPRAGAQDHLLFLIHGYGEPPEMFLEHLDRLDPEGRYLLATPVAPFEKKGKPIWHRALFGDADQAAEQFLASMDALVRCLAAVTREGGFPMDRTVIGGFSQGAGMAVGLTLSPGELAPPAGCLAFCGFVPPVPGLRVRLSRARGVPLFLSIADDDAFITLDASRASAGFLTEMGFDVELHELRSRHEITAEAAALAGEWLRGCANRCGTRAVDGVREPRSNGRRQPAPTPAALAEADGAGLREYALSLWEVDPE